MQALPGIGKPPGGGGGFGVSMAEVVTYFTALSGTFSLYDFRPGTNSIYSDTGRTTSITGAGTGVAGVKDLGNNGRHLSQSTAGSRPTSTAAATSFDGTDDLLTNTTANFPVGSCCIVASIVSGQGANPGGIVTNTSDGTSNIDVVFSIDVIGTSWENQVATAGNGMGNNSRENQVATRAITFDAAKCWYEDATGYTFSLLMPGGIVVGSDRNIAGRLLQCTVYGIFTHSTVLSSTDRNWIEKSFSNIFGLGF